MKKILNILLVCFLTFSGLIVNISNTFAVSVSKTFDFEGGIINEK